MRLEESGVYKNHRSYPTRLPGGVWVVSVVKPGVATAAVSVGSGPQVERIWGEYPFHEEVVSAAKHHIDQGTKPSEAASP